jgi:hypothetical protein
MKIKSTTAFRAYANARAKRSIEQADATPAEAARAMALLTKLAG